MSTLNLKAQLTSVGAVNNAYIFLEKLPTPENPYTLGVGLIPKNAARKEWNNNNIKIEVEGTLEIQLNVHAFKNTEWTFKLTNKDDDKVIFNKTGKTGNTPSDGLNISIIKDSIKI